LIGDSPVLRCRHLRIRNVQLLGFGGRVAWKQGDAEFKVQMPAETISEIGITLKVEVS
jgi:hypothetical protein